MNLVNYHMSWPSKRFETFRNSFFYYLSTAPCCLLLWCVLPSGIVGAQTDSAVQWSRFRGPNGSGVADASSIPSQWSEGDYAWVAELPGVGNSSPVVWGKRVYVTAAEETSGTRSLVCVDLHTGKELWRAAEKFKSYKKHKNNSFASATPAVDSERVYQLWHSKQSTTLIAYSHEGDEKWRAELGAYLHGQGGATSPVVAGDYVVVAHDHKADSFLMALDRKTGKEHWKIPREGKRACYSTPCLRNVDGVPEVVFVHCYEGVTGIDLETGRLNWKVDPFGRESQRALASPVVSGNLVLAGSGAIAGDRQVVAIKIGQKVNAEAAEVYRVVRQAPHVPTPLILNGRVYLWNDGGICTCCQLDDGEVIWQKRVGGSFFSSPIAIGNRIFSIDTNGEVVVLAASDTYRVIARNPMGQGSRSTMAVAENTLLIRTAGKLFAIRGE